jgi:hypothetical protein
VENLGVGLQVGVADLAVQFDNPLQLGDCPVEVSPSAMNHRHAVAGHRLTGPVADLPRDRQSLRVVLQCPLSFAQAVVHAADVVQRGGLVAAVARRLVQAQRLVVGDQRRGPVPGGVSGPATRYRATEVRDMAALEAIRFLTEDQENL